MGKAIYWLRNDLRLHDNLTLQAFCQKTEQGLIVWTPSTSFLRADRFRRNFILASLQEFKLQAEKRGARVLITKLSLAECLSRLLGVEAFSSLLFSKESAPEELAEEASPQRFTNLQQTGYSQGALLNENLLPFSASDTPEVFTQFRKRVEDSVQVQAPLPTPNKIPGWDKALSRDASASLEEWDLSAELLVADQHPRIQPGEAAGLERVQDYIWKLDRLQFYKETRNGMIDWDDSSKFSPWLSVGALSPRHVFAEVKRFEAERVQNDSTYWMYFELLWRDYFRLIVAKHGGRIFAQGPKASKRPLHHRVEESLFAEWATGETSDDFVNANMRELNQTGWMSNRGRQNVASYLAKTLGVDWRLGADYFERMLIDYDVYSNWGNWAYLAGVGQDPRDRTFNTVRQAAMYDPEGAYRSLWLGEEPKRKSTQDQ